MSCYRNILLLSIYVLLTITGCKEAVVKSPAYKPYLDSANAKEKNIMSGILDTIAFMFKKDPPGVKDKATYYKLKGIYYRNTGDYASSLKSLDTLKTLLIGHETEAFYKELYPATLLLMAENYTELELHEPAISLLFTASKFIGENTSDNCSEANSHAKIAEIFMFQQRNKMAVNHFLSCYEAAQRCNKDSFDRFYHSYSSLYKVSSCYLALKMYDSAQHYADEAMNYVLNNESKFPEKADYFVLCKAIINANIAAIKVNAGEYPEAERLMLATIRETAEMYPSFIYYCKLDLLNIYLRSNKLVEAKQVLTFFDTSANSGQTFFASRQMNTLAEYTKNYYKKTGNYKQALTHAEKVIHYYDSVTLAKRFKTEKDPGLEFENRSQVMANELLKTRYEQKSFQLLASVLIIVLVVIVAAFIASHSKRTERHARMQEYLNHEIQLKNDELKDAYTSLESSYNANTELMLTVAHDLKNPIVGITNLSKILLKNHPPNLKESLCLIVTASINATNLINNLMNKNDSRPGVGEKKINNMMGLVEYCTELMTPKAKQKKQTLYLHGEPANALINKNEMWRVITNLINNAIKFSPENTTIDILLQKQGSAILLSVKDEGIGMPKHILEGLFTQGAEVQRTGTAGEPSYGFGLKISKRIIEQHQGSLWAESIEGQGSTFFIKLPAEKQEAQRSLVTEKATKPVL